MKDTKHAIERLPKESYRGLLGEYVEIMSPTTEAPREFHAGAFLTAVGAAFADAQLQAGTFTEHPRFFTLLVGPTGIRKTTVRTFAVRFLSDVAPDIPVVKAEGSRQGLTERLIRASQQNMTVRHMQYPDPRITSFKMENGNNNGMAAEGRPAILNAGEFTTNLKQAARSSTSDLSEFWLDLYDGTDIANNVRSRPLLLVNPTASLLGDSTEEGLAEIMGDDTVNSGLLNRMSIFLGTDPGEPKPIPPAPDAERLEALKREISGLRESFGSEALIDYAEDGRDAFNTLYRETLHPRRNSDIGPVIAREGSQLQRFAMLIAILRGSPTISAEDISQSWDIVRYLSTSALSLAGKIGEGPRSSALNYLEGRIEAMGAEGIRTPNKNFYKLNQQITRGRRNDFTENFRNGIAGAVRVLVQGGQVKWDGETLVHKKYRPDDFEELMAYDLEKEAS